ncbi:MAG: hypothetical protein F2578_04535 [Actinobacteria bacterium]|nr:hypothetical protein [Actinomycetota bacterium]
MKTNCLYCQTALDDDRAPRCPSCSARHHLECWDENGGCSQFGCDSGP